MSCAAKRTCKHQDKGRQISQSHSESSQQFTLCSMWPAVLHRLSPWLRGIAVLVRQAVAETHPCLLPLSPSLVSLVHGDG